MWLRLFQTSWINPWLTYIPKEIHFLQWCILIESKREEQRIESCTLPRNALSCKGATSGTKEGGASDRCRGRAHVGKLCSEASDVLDANWFSRELQKRPLRKGPPASHVQMNQLRRLFLACKLGAPRHPYSIVKGPELHALRGGREVHEARSMSHLCPVCGLTVLRSPPDCCFSTDLYNQSTIPGDYSCSGL